MLFYFLINSLFPHKKKKPILNLDLFVKATCQTVGILSINSVFLSLVGYSEMVTVNVCKATFRDIFIQGMCSPFVITVTEHDFPGQKIDFKA